MTLRFIQVGLGNWGQSWFRNIVSENKAVETVAWVEVDAATLTTAQQQLDLPAARCFLSLEQALAAVQADAVLVSASLPGHVPSACTALLAGKHVLLEKPFAPSIAEGLQLVSLAEQHGLTLMVSQNYRFHPAVRKAAELVRAQTLGNVGSVSLDFRRYANTAPVATNRHYHIWHPLLADMSIHHFDLMRAVLGREPSQVICKTWNPSWSNFVEPPAAALTITFEGGTVVNYRGNWVSQGPQTSWAGEWHMDCAGGEIVWTSRGDLPDTMQLRPRDQPAHSVPLQKLPFQDRAGSLDAFVQAVQNGEAPENSGRDNLKTLAFMFAAIESADTGLPVTIVDPFFTP